MRVFRIAGLLIVASLGLNGCGPTTGSSVVQASRASNQLAETNSGLPVEIRVGDPDTSYASVEFTRDGRYMVWFEGVEGNRTGRMWHCAVNSETGTLTPPDCKGFRAFQATAFGRANVGYDASGPYYVGANTRGELVMVRPTGATTGNVTKLPVPADTSRIGIYPSQLTDRDGGYVAWLKRLGNQKELQYIDLAAPSVIRTIERQSALGRVGLTPMEIGFYRMVNGRPWVTYGAFDSSRNLQVKMADLSRPGEPARFVTSEAGNKLDPYGFAAPDGRTYLVAGVDAKPLLRVYRYNGSSGRFSQQNEIRVPAASQLANPTLAQSFEPVFKGGRILGTYQVNDGSGDARSDRPAGRFQGRAAGRFQGRAAGQFQAGGAGPSGFINTAFQSPGEIWLADLTDLSRPQVRLSGTAPLIRTEPEPLSGTNTRWIFYNTAPLGSTLLQATWQLRRSQVP